MTRRRSQSVAEVLASLTSGPYLPGLAEHLEGARIGRRRNHPTWVPVAYGALARHFRSHNRLDGELTTGLWPQLRTAALGAGLEDPGDRPYLYPQHTYWRDRVMRDPERREDLLASFTDLALVQARSFGLLLPDGPGSVTHPHPSRTVYGDGTVVRPVYRRPRTDVLPGFDPDTGEVLPGRTRRHDPSAADFYRWDGLVHGNNFVAVHARDDRPGGRVVLGLARVDAPGREADTAVALIESVCAAAGPGITAAVYDGAFRGVHIDRLMHRSGLVVINKVHAAARSDTTTAPRRRPLGTFTHKVGRRGTCTHALHVEDGTVVDVALADDGTPVTVATAARRQVKRTRRGDGTYRFSLGIDVPCRHGDLRLWLSPHATDDDPGLPDHLRLVPPADPDFEGLYGLRNDSESFNSQYKRTLLVDRATSVGWERQLFDVLTFAVLENSRASKAAESQLRLVV